MDVASTGLVTDKGLKYILKCKALNLGVLSWWQLPGKETPTLRRKSFLMLRAVLRKVVCRPRDLSCLWVHSH